MDVLIIISYIVLVLAMPVLMYLEHKITCRRLEHSIFWNQYFEILHTSDDNIADVKMDIYKKCYEEVWDEKKKII